MHKPLFYIIGTLAGIALALAWLTWGVGRAAVYHEALPERGVPHLYATPERSIEEIEIRAFYFVPRDKEDAVVEEWRELMAGALDSLVAFHALQTQHRSRISYTLFPSAVIGEREHLFYDTDSTERGNPHALISVGEELERRVSRPKGDLYDSRFAVQSGDHTAKHVVFFIMYEGVGSAGGMIHESERESAQEIAGELGLSEDVVFVVNIESVDGFFLVNREIVGGVHGLHGASIVAHEFYHTLGVPDAYLAYNETPTSDDLMGLGRFREIERTYLGAEVLEGLGL